MITGPSLNSLLQLHELFHIQQYLEHLADSWHREERTDCKYVSGQSNNCRIAKAKFALRTQIDDLKLPPPPPHRCRAEWLLLIWKADPLRPEPADQRPEGDAYRLGRETQPSLPGSRDQHLHLQPLSGSCDQGAVPWSLGQHHLHDACRVSAAGGGQQDCGQRERARSERGAEAGSGEGVSPAGGLRTERGLRCGRGHGSLWPPVNWTRPPPVCLHDWEFCTLTKANKPHTAYFILKCKAKAVFDGTGIKCKEFFRTKRWKLLHRSSNCDWTADNNILGLSGCANREASQSSIQMLSETTSSQLTCKHSSRKWAVEVVPWFSFFCCTINIQSMK